MDNQLDQAQMTTLIHGRSIKTQRRSIPCSKDFVKNKKLVEYLRRRMFTGFIKLKELSENKNKTLAHSSKFKNNKFSKFHLDRNLNLQLTIEKYTDYDLQVNKTNLDDIRPCTYKSLFLTDRNTSDIVKEIRDLKKKEIAEKEKENLIMNQIFDKNLENSNHYNSVPFISFEIKRQLLKNNYGCEKVRIEKALIKEIENIKKVSEDLNYKNQKIKESFQNNFQKKISQSDKNSMNKNVIYSKVFSEFNNFIPKEHTHKNEFYKTIKKNNSFILQNKMNKQEIMCQSNVNIKSNQFNEYCLKSKNNFKIKGNEFRNSSRQEKKSLSENKNKFLLKNYLENKEDSHLEMQINQRSNTKHLNMSHIEFDLNKNLNMNKCQENVNKIINNKKSFDKSTLNQISNKKEKFNLLKDLLTDSSFTRTSTYKQRSSRLTYNSFNKHNSNIGKKLSVREQHSKISRNRDYIISKQLCKLFDKKEVDYVIYGRT